MLQRIAEGRTDLVLEWVASGKPADATDGGGVSLLRWCAYYGDVSAIRFLLAHGQSLSVLGEDLGLRGAAFHGHWRLCEFLLEQGADVRAVDPANGETALHAALCVANRPAQGLVVQVLLARGADPNARTRAGAPTDGFMRDVRTRGESPLHRAAAYADEETIRRLLEAGAQVDARDGNGDTPLSWASWHLRPDSILRLLCHGLFTIHPQRSSTFDHGTGWRVMDRALLGTPRP